jgi:photosystem II stability/assembly factor-like uncharacterized protein
LEQGLIIYTSNGGTNWNKYTSASILPFLEGVCYSGTDTVFTYSINTNVFRSTDNGLSWSKDSTKVTSISFFPNSKIGLAIHYDNPGLYILKTEDAGMSWNSIYYSTSYSLNKILCLNDGTCFAIGNVLIKSSDWGSTWQLINTGFVHPKHARVRSSF